MIPARSPRIYCTIRAIDNNFIDFFCLLSPAYHCKKNSVLDDKNLCSFPLKEFRPVFPEIIKKQLLLLSTKLKSGTSTPPYYLKKRSGNAK
jgi:hypothetical protein